MTKLADLGIREGTSKEKVAIVFLDKGKEAAVKKGVALDLQESTVKTWCSAWKGMIGGPKKTAKKAAPAKAPAKKAAPAKAPAKKTAAKAPAKPAKKVEREQLSA